MSIVSERPHGYARYKLDGCRCGTCRAAVSAYNRRNAMAVTAGTWCPYVDAGPARAHVKAAQAAGIGWRRFVALSGVPRSTVKQLLYGRPDRAPSRRLRVETAERILAFQFTPAARAAGVSIDATGTHRRIQALACLGWSLSEQARRVGQLVSNYANFLQRTQITMANADKVRALYDELSMTVAPAGYGSTRVRKLATQRRWRPPLAWDDDTIDDPAARSEGRRR